MKTNKLKLGLLFVTVLATSVLFTTTSHADVEYRQTCNLMVFPYDPAAASDTIGPDGDQYLNRMSDDVCRAHLVYPNAYVPDPPIYEENVVKAGAEHKRVPITQHQHAYTNEDNYMHPQDPDHAGRGVYYYKAGVDKFEITIRSVKNRNNNTDKLFNDQITCVTPVGRNYAGDASDLYDCNGRADDLFGGTVVTKETRGNDIVITWDFGNNNNSLRPILFGNNGANFTVYRADNSSYTLDTTNWQNRTLPFYVNLPTRDNGQIWDITTTSRVSIAHLAILQSQVSADPARNKFNTGCPDGNLLNPNNGWCYSPPPPGYPTYTVTDNPQAPRTYYWYPIGSVGTVWKKPPVPPATLTLIKKVVNTHGGTRRPEDFQLRIIGPTQRDRLPATSRQAYTFTFANNNPLRLRANEDPVPGYSPSEWGRHCDRNGDVTLLPGDNKVCEITNSDLPPPPPATLRLIKEVVNTGGGTARVEDFNLYINDITGPSPGTRQQVRSDQVVTLQPGTYRASEDGKPNYTASNWMDDCALNGSITLRAGEHRTCKIKNTFIPPPPRPATLRLIKDVDNSAGGTSTRADFPLYIKGPNPSNEILQAVSGEVYTLPPGSYQLSEENNNPRYEASPWSGVMCDPIGLVTLQPGDNKVCKIKNTYIPPPPPEETTLTLFKIVVNDDGGTSTPEDFPLYINILGQGGLAQNEPEPDRPEKFLPNRPQGLKLPPKNGRGQNQLLADKLFGVKGFFARPIIQRPERIRVISGTKTVLLPGSYKAGETNSWGYSNAGWTGDCAQNGNITLAVGDNKTCTIINNDRPVIIPPSTLTLIKEVINDGGGTAGPDDFPLYINIPGQDSVRVTNNVAYPVEAGHYTVREDNNFPDRYSPFPWQGDCSADGNIDIAPGENKVCKIINRYIPPNMPRAMCLNLSLRQSKIMMGQDPTLFNPQAFDADVTWSDPAVPGVITWEHTKNGAQIESVTAADLFHYTFGLSADKLLGPDSVIKVSASPRDNSDACTRQIVAEKPNIPPDNPPPPDNPQQPNPNGTLNKGAFEITSHGNIITKLNPNAEFKLTFTPLATVPELIIRDSVGSIINDTIRGSHGSPLSLNRNAFGAKGFAIQRSGGGEIPQCPGQNANAICYQGSPFNGSSIRILNVTTNDTFTITYRMTLTNSNITPARCKGMSRDMCGEKFENRANARTPDGRNFGDVGASLFTPCPFLVTQGIGDVILQQELSVGSDIWTCEGIPNIEGPVIEIPDITIEIPKMGEGDLPRVAPHTVCKQSNKSGSDSPNAYKNPIESLSSAVCEMSLTLADSLTVPQIRTDVLENITRITRFNNNLGEGDITINDLNAPGPQGGASPNPNYEIYKLKNGDMTIPRGMQVTSGSRTYVIENGDLIIKGNITYEDTPLDLTDIKKIPSIAFIVINGDIKIDPTVTQLAGVFVTLKREGSLKGGRIDGTASSDGNASSSEPLKIEGSVYGDIQPLFEKRTYIGSARQGKGTITINYDGRLFYNMPPGLKEILDVSQEQVAR